MWTEDPQRGEAVLMLPTRVDKPVSLLFTIRRPRRVVFRRRALLISLPIMYIRAGHCVGKYDEGVRTCYMFFLSDAYDLLVGNVLPPAIACLLS